MKIRRVIFAVIASILLFVACAVIGGYSFYIKAFVSVVLYFSVYLVLCRNLDSAKHRWVVLATLGIIPLVVYTFIHSNNFNDSIPALPSSYAFLLGLLFAILWQLKLRKILLLIGAVIITPLYSILLTNQLTEYTNTSEVITGNNRELSNIVILDAKGNIVTPDLLKNEILILNFWNTGCGVCKQEFPHFEELAIKYNTHARVKLVSVNVPMPRDSGNQGLKYIESKNYKIPAYYMIQRDASSAFGITSFPTLLLIRNGKDVELINDINDLEHEINEALIQ